MAERREDVGVFAPTYYYNFLKRASSCSTFYHYRKLAKVTTENVLFFHTFAPIFHFNLALMEVK